MSAHQPVDPAQRRRNGSDDDDDGHGDANGRRQQSAATHQLPVPLAVAAQNANNNRPRPRRQHHRPRHASQIIDDEVPPSSSGSDSDSDAGAPPAQAAGAVAAVAQNNSNMGGKRAVQDNKNSNAFNGEPVSATKSFKCFCCSVHSRETYDQKLQEAVFSREEVKREMEILPWDIDALPPATGFGRVRNQESSNAAGNNTAVIENLSWSVMRSVVLWLGDMRSLLALRQCSTAMNILLDRHPAWHWLLPLRYELLPCAVQLRWDLPPVLRRRYFSDPADPTGPQHYVLELARADAAHRNLGKTNCDVCVQNTLGCVCCCAGFGCCCSEGRKCGDKQKLDDDEIDQMAQAQLNEFRKRSGLKFAQEFVSTEDRAVAQVAIPDRKEREGIALSWVERLKNVARPQEKKQPGGRSTETSLQKPLRGEPNNNNNNNNNDDDDDANEGADRGGGRSYDGTRKNTSSRRNDEDAGRDNAHGLGRVGVLVFQEGRMRDDSASSDASATSTDDKDNDDNSVVGERQQSLAIDKPLAVALRAIPLLSAVVYNESSAQTRARLRALSNMTMGVPPGAGSRAPFQKIADFRANHDEEGYLVGYAHDNARDRVRIVMRRNKQRPGEDETRVDDNNVADDSQRAGQRNKVITSTPPLTMSSLFRREITSAVNAPNNSSCNNNNTNSSNNNNLTAFPRGLVAEDSARVSGRRYVRALRTCFLTEKNLDLLLGGVSHRREHQFTSLSSYTATCKSITQLLAENARVSYVKNRVETIWKLIAAQFVYLVINFGMSIALGLGMEDTVFSPKTDFVLGRNIALITVALAVTVNYCGIILVWSNCRAWAHRPSTDQRAIIFNAVCMMLLMLCAPAALVAFRVSASQRLIDGGSLSVCDAWANISASRTISAEICSQSSPPSLPRELLPTRLAESATFLSFPPGTRILFHPPLRGFRGWKSIPINQVMYNLSNDNKSDGSGGAALWLEFVQPVVPYTLRPSVDTATRRNCSSIYQNTLANLSGYRTTVTDISRGVGAYYSIILPESCEAPRRGISNNATVLIVGDDVRCPFWAHGGAGKMHTRFVGVLRNESAASALENASDALMQPGLANAMQLWNNERAHDVNSSSSSGSASSSARCPLSSFLVTVGSDADFSLRVSREFTPHWSSSYYLQRVPTPVRPWRVRSRWTDTDDYKLNGIVALMADSSMFFARRPSAVLHPDMILNPFLAAANSSSEMTTSLDDVWTGATPRGLQAIHDDYRRGLVNLVIAIAVVFGVAAWLAMWSRTVSRSVFGVVTWVFFFSVTWMPLPILVITATCYANGATYDKDELLAPTFCLQADSSDMLGVLITSAIVFGLGICSTGMLLYVICALSQSDQENNDDDDNA